MLCAISTYFSLCSLLCSTCSSGAGSGSVPLAVRRLIPLAIKSICRFHQSPFPCLPVSVPFSRCFLLRLPPSTFCFISYFLPSAPHFNLYSFSFLFSSILVSANHPPSQSISSTPLRRHFITKLHLIFFFIIFSLDPAGRFFSCTHNHRQMQYNS